MNTRYLLLGIVACASAVVTAAPARASIILPPCDKPIAQLTLDQIQTCQVSAKILDGAEDALRELQERQRENEKGPAQPCGMVKVMRGDGTSIVMRPSKCP